MIASQSKLVTDDRLNPPQAPRDIEAMIAKLAQLLPAQGPITAFAFLNPLQGMEDQPFADAIRHVNEIFGCEPFLQEGEYRERMAKGRIGRNDLVETLAEEPDAIDDRLIAGLIRRSDLRMSMLEHSINPGTENELRWELAEAESMRRLRWEVSPADRDRMIDSTKQWCERGFRLPSELPAGVTSDGLSAAMRDAASRSRFGWFGTSIPSSWEPVCLGLLWHVTTNRIRNTPRPASIKPTMVRHRDLLLDATREDVDLLINEVLIRFCSAYLDQGYAHWRLPSRELGFFQSFLVLHSSGGTFTKRWLRPLMEEARRLQTEGVSATECIKESLRILGVDDEETESFLRGNLLALRGYAGMIWQCEVRPDRVFIASPSGTLVDYVAVRLLLKRFALKWLAKETLRYTGSLDHLRDELRAKQITREVEITDDQRAYPIFQLAQIHGWTPEMLAGLSPGDWGQLAHGIESFSAFERRRVFQLAFERQLTHHALDAIAVRASQPPRGPESPQLQVFTCLDAREESFRRHIEEVAPEVETFGNAGFFNVPMYYRGAGDAHFAAHCPIVIKPQQWIVEDIVHSLADSGRQRARVRKILGTATHNFNTGTRGSLTGAVLTAAIGPLFTIPLVGRILFPRLTAKMHRTARRLVAPPPITRLRLERPEGTTAGPTDEGIGFTLSEMCTMAERSLRDTGLTKNFARLVIILGHGSNCLNNPHESAYHCGACSGSIGAPNARALAAIINDPRVRRTLASRGLPIPEETQFLGGQHNTANEAITFFDLELLPTSHVRDLRFAMSIFDRVAERNSHERCRRFESAPLDISPGEALQHVEDRAEDLAQTRPEYGNCTNAICFVGRRSRIRGLYLDRRSFLMSYDAAQDNETSVILTRILAAVIPVCEGINMLYTLSRIDNTGWGCGTKLPHNITSLLGVMDGAASDLRPGLPWQGVDIHEPVRVLFVIEASAEAMLGIMDANVTVGNICRNGWAQLAVLDPLSNRIQQFVDGKFVDYEPGNLTLETATSSAQWYRGKRGDLPFATIDTTS